MRGSAIILAMLILVLISATGIYVISLPHPIGKDLRKYEREAAAKYMAIAGVHAAIARLSSSSPDGVPYVRYFDISQNMTGKYSASLRESAGPFKNEPAGDPLAREYVVVSEGAIVQSGEARHIIRATVRHSPGGRKSRIVSWEESK